MFHNRALAANVAHTIIYFTILVSSLADGRTVVAQELSPTILQLIPHLADKLHYGDIYERIGVLDELVRIKSNSDVPELLFRYNLLASDYSIVVRSILAGNLGNVDERRASTTWWKLNHVVRVFRLKEVVKPLTGYLLKSGPPVQWDILQTLKTLQAVEGVPEIMPLLRSPEEYIRREALDTLVSLRSSDAVPTLVALLEDKDAQRRFYALTSLVKVNGREATPAIARALEDESEDIRYWALDALVKLNGREYAPAIWKFTGDGQRPQTEAYALSALISFAEPRAIPLVVKRATESDLTRRSDMLNYLIEVKAGAIAPAFIAVLESHTVLGGNPADPGTDSNIRRDLMVCLGQLRAREAIPVLRDYARGRDSDRFLQRAAVMTLG